MTPETRAARDRIAAYLDALARNHPNVPEIDMEIAHTDDPNQWLERPLMASDLRTVLEALDQQPDHILITPDPLSESDTARAIRRYLNPPGMPYGLTPHQTSDQSEAKDPQ